MWTEHISALKRNFTNIGENVRLTSLKIHQERFMKMKDPHGNKWASLTPAYAEKVRKYGPGIKDPSIILRRTETLYKSLDIRSLYVSNSLAVSVQFIYYGDFHQNNKRKKRQITVGYTSEESKLLANSISESFKRNGLWK